jgi:hypothetical protein
MKEHRIVVEIGRDGSVAADADGFTGDTCISELERLLAGLATTATALNRKPDGKNPRVQGRSQEHVTAGRKP